jgi:serine/threonine-protein kinase
MEDPLVGQPIGNYIVRSLIGRGGMGAVYVAEHPEIGRRVAVKVLAPELGHVPGLSERFVAEARAATRIEHPNVITIFDFGRTASGQLYQVIELLKGRDLSQLIRERGALPLAEVVPYVEQLCDGLTAAHEQGVVHRDLKPENIFVLDRQPLALKILDFGIAKLLEPGAQAAPHTVTGMVIGSPFTIAPEQAAGQRDAIGPRTDLYSLGVIVYWLLAGRPPFSEGPTAVLLAKHITEAPPPLGALAPALPPAVAALVHLCLEKEPARRPASARELRDAFAVAARSPIPASRPAAVPATIISQASPAVTPPGPTPSQGTGWAPLRRPAAEPGPGTTLRGAAAEVVSVPASAPRRSALWLGLAAAGVAAAAAIVTVAVWPREPRSPDGSRLASAQPPRPDASRAGAPGARPDAGRASASAAKPDAGRVSASGARPDAGRVSAASRADGAAAPTTVLAAATPKSKAAPPKAKTTPPKAKTTPTAPAPASGSVGELLARARNAFGNGQHTAAFQHARAALRLEPHNTDALAILAMAACRTGQRKAARSAYGQLPASRQAMLRGACAKHGIVLEPGATGPAAPAPTPGGRLTPAAVITGMRGVRASIGACMRSPGIVTVVITIAPSGSVTSATILGPLAGTPDGDCVAAAARRARFPAFEGEPVTVRFPFKK